jgi:serine/threonine-protein kinase
MGTVLEAEHRELGKHFVVKLLRTELTNDDRQVKRLRLEARSLAKLDSPHVVTVSDLGRTASGATYVAMELLHGRTLRAELAERARGVIPVAEAIAWMRQVLAGLAAAHRNRIIHRDVKLDNLFLCDATENQPQRVKVLDFGIAKWLDDATTGQGARPVTAQGVFIGTPRYISPEQALCKPIDARADIYSAGLVLYQLVAGKGPFAHHTNAVDLLTAQLNEKPQPPSAVAPQTIPAELDAVVLKAIEKAPADRFQTAEAFAAALEAIDLTGIATQGTGVSLVRAEARAALSDPTTESVTLVRPTCPLPVAAPLPSVIKTRPLGWPAAFVDPGAIRERGASITSPLPPLPSDPPPAVAPLGWGSKPARPVPDEEGGIDVRKFVLILAATAVATLLVVTALLHFYAAGR